MTTSAKPFRILICLQQRGTILHPKATYYRQIFYEALDLITQAIESRFDQPGYRTYRCLEDLVLKAANKEGYSKELKAVTRVYRSFSAMRRIKSYLRSTMSQGRLNYIMVLSVHKDLTDKMNLVDVANNFVSASENHLRVFGHFSV